MFLRAMSYLRAVYLALRMPFILMPWSLRILLYPGKIFGHYRWCVANEKSLEPFRRESAKHGFGYGYWPKKK